ncbi:MAG: M12 family metallo-peptidase [Acidobacteriota bacterium]
MRKTLLCTAALILMSATVLVAQPTAELSRDLQALDLSTAARSLPVDGQLRLSGVDLGLGQKDLVLQRFRVFAPGAEIVIHGDDGDRVVGAPDNAYFRGYVEGRGASVVLLSALENGQVRGLVAEGSRYWVLGETAPGDDASVLAVREVDAAQLAEQVTGFACDTEHLEAEATGAAPLFDKAYVERNLAEIFRPAAERVLGRGVTNTARIAIESDNEFLNLFGGNTTNATNYLGDIIAYSSAVYVNEVDTSMEIVHVSLWTTADPWTQFSTICGLFEFGKYWNDNNDSIDRTLVHFMSGKNNGGGVAWVGVLCNGGFDYNTGPNNCGFSPANDNFGGDYGYSGTLDGDFDIDNPTVVWDIVVVAHEIGHNFDSPHTHCYNGIGNPSPIDQCYGVQQGCYAGGASLPCGSAGAGCGTIMSYCHLLGGGISNIGFTLGQGHAWGVMPERVPQRMAAHVADRAAAVPGCLDPINIAEVFLDGFEIGNLSAWSNTVVD